jgi:asparagine synthase (glutamine-hydrolysing)
MCGLIGLANWGDRDSLARMTDLLTYRGPDDCGIWDERLPDGGYMGLGARRLAIRDLSPAGHMPMPNENETLWIAFNGEIYNYGELKAEMEARGHTFRSGSDTEVILHMYEDEGPDCVRRLNGMFAVAIWDLRRHGDPILFLARDHFGIKPLYYVHCGTRLAVASEAKALFELDGVEPRLDLAELDRYMTFLWVPEPQTLFEGIHKIPAAHWGIFRHGQLQLREYWNVSYRNREAGGVESLHCLQEQLRDHLERAVTRQLVSDVPVGALLSSGIDSSSIVALMARNMTEPLHTYTISFPPQYRVGEVTLDDPSIARRLAHDLGCVHEDIVVEAAASDLLPSLIWHMDDPVADPAIITSYLVCHSARRDVTVLLSGIGGDELFAGYRKHSAQRWTQLYRLLPAALRSNAVEPIIDAIPSLRGTQFKGYVRLMKKLVRSGSLSPRHEFLMNSTYVDDDHKAALYSPALRRELQGPPAWSAHTDLFEQVEYTDFINQMLYLDTKMFMPSLNLNYNDKMSMASSVEMRVPFLDLDLVNFAARDIPVDLKVGGPLKNQTKFILRQAMRGVVPDETLVQKKAGFGAPIDYWLAYDLRDMVGDLLSEDRLLQRGLFKPATVRRMIAEQRDGRRDWSLQVWQLLTLELWMQTFVDRSTGSTPLRPLPAASTSLVRSALP